MRTCALRSDISWILLTNSLIRTRREGHFFACCLMKMLYWQIKMFEEFSSVLCHRELSLDSSNRKVEPT